MRGVEIIQARRQNSQGRSCSINKINIEDFKALKEARSLLVDCGLPIGDVKETNLIKYFGVRESSKLIGVAGLEVIGNVALLRSVAVSPDNRKKNIGQCLVKYAESKAYSIGINEIYLLTTTAQEYFYNLGYRVASRKYVPPEIKGTQQFSTICPSSAVLMRKELYS